MVQYTSVIISSDEEISWCNWRNLEQDSVTVKSFSSFYLHRGEHFERVVLLTFDISNVFIVINHANH